MTHHSQWIKRFLGLSISLIIIGQGQAQAAVELGLRIGTDSNIYRSIDEPQSDQYLNTSLVFAIPDNTEQGLNLTFQSLLEGYAYNEATDLDSGSITLSPGILYVFSPKWQVRIAPSFQGTIVNDSNQSELAFGGTMGLENQWTRILSSSLYYRYTDSRTQEDVYSTTENIAGGTMGINLTSALYSNIGYELAHGTSYQTVTSSTLVPTGRRIFRQRYSTQLNSLIVQDTQNTQTASVRIGYSFKDSITTELGYVYRMEDSNIGVSRSNEVNATVFYRF